MPAVISMFWTYVVIFFKVTFLNIVGKFTAWAWTGAITKLLIFVAYLAVISGLIAMLITYANQYIVTAINNSSGLKSVILSPFAAFLPPSLVTCASIVIGFYVTTTGFNIVHQIVLLKRRMAQQATNHMWF
jgi:hypothetical protein